MSVEQSAVSGSVRSQGGPGRKSWFRLPVRMLLTSTAFPPLTAGHAVVLDRLFRDLHPDDYRIVHFDDYADQENLHSGWSALPAPTFRYPSDWWQYLPDYPLSYVRRLRQLVGTVASTARTLAKICSAEQCRAIVVTTGTLPRLPAAALAAKLARVPLILLIWDFWRYLELDPFHRWVAETLEPAVLRSAAAVVVPNEMLAESIARLTGVRSVIIRLPIDDAALLGQGADPPPRQDSNGFSVVFTGQVYMSMTDPFNRLLAALEEPGMEDVTVHYHGRQSKEVLDVIGVKGRYVPHAFVPPPAVYDVQRDADVLFLSLAFEGLHENLVYSSSTTKLADYLAAGRPILVHAPPGAFPAWYVRRHRCGLVIDTPDPKALARAIALLRQDEGLRLRLGRNALARARADFSIDEARRRLAQLLADVTGTA